MGVVRFLSVCSGIEAASVAWKPLGWEAIGFSEIEPFPSAVLKHHYPDVPNYGDMAVLAARITAGEIETPDLLCGGTPCQAFSVAGLRKSLDDARGNLSLTFCEIANAIDTVRDERREEPCIVFWENVPGVLNTKDNAFGCFLAGLAGEDQPLESTGGRWTNAGYVLGPQRAVAWRVLDAQYFGVAQRRRRVFVVASARDGFNPAEILFEWEGVRRDTPPSREAGQGAARSTESGVGSGSAHAFKVRGGCEGGGKGYLGSDEVAFTLSTLQDQTIHCFDRQQIGGYGNGPVASTLAARDYKDPTDLVTQTYSTSAIGHIVQDDVASTITKNTSAGGETQNPAFVAQPIGFNTRQDPDAWQDRTGPVDTHYGTQGVAQPINIYGGNKRSDRPEGGFYVRTDEDTSKTLDAASGLNPTCSLGGTAVMQPVAIHENQRAEVTLNDTVGTVKCAGGKPGQGYPAAMVGMQVRRLTPTECERLQGFPDGYTAIPWRNKPESPDGPRYKALGNSWAVPVVRWIGERIKNHLSNTNYRRVGADG